MNWTTFAHELKQQFRLPLLSGGPRRTGIRARVHQRLQSRRDVTVIDKEIFCDVERRITPLEIAGAIVPYAVPQYQILRPRRRTNRIGLHKPHLLQGPIQRSCLGKVPRDGIAPQLVKVHDATIAQGWVFSRSRNNGIMELHGVLNVKPLILNDGRPRENIMNPQSLRLLLFPFLLALVIASTGTNWSRVSAGGGEEWRPVDPADLALKSAVVEPNADAEAIFWDI